MLSILYEDNYLMAVNKPAGLRSEGNPGLESEVAFFLKEKYPWKRQLITGVVHRLDRPVSGVMLFALTPMALKELGKQFGNRTVQKFYLALCASPPPANSGELSHWLLKDSKNKKAAVFDHAVKDAQLASLRYQVLEEKQGLFLLEIELLTGRYHQIRAQLCAVSVPIVGDVKYGSNLSVSGAGICLHAYRLIVRHPKTGDMLELTAPAPNAGLWENFSNQTESEHVCE